MWDPQRAWHCTRMSALIPDLLWTPGCLSPIPCMVWIRSAKSWGAERWEFKATQGSSWIQDSTTFLPLFPVFWFLFFFFFWGGDGLWGIFLLSRLLGYVFKKTFFFFDPAFFFFFRYFIVVGFLSLSSAYHCQKAAKSTFVSPSGQAFHFIFYDWYLLIFSLSWGCQLFVWLIRPSPWLANTTFWDGELRWQTGFRWTSGSVCTATGRCLTQERLCYAAVTSTPRNLSDASRINLFLFLTQPDGGLTVLQGILLPLGDLDFFHLEALPSGMHDLLGPRDRWSIPCIVFKFQAWIGLMSLISLFLISHWPEMVTWLHPHAGARKWMAGHGYLESANKFCQDGKRDIAFAVPINYC